MILGSACFPIVPIVRHLSPYSNALLLAGCGNRGQVLAYDTLLKYFMDAGHSMPAALEKLSAHPKPSAVESGLGRKFGQCPRFHAAVSTRSFQLLTRGTMVKSTFPDPPSSLPSPRAWFLLQTIGLRTRCASLRRITSPAVKIFPI